MEYLLRKGTEAVIYNKNHGSKVDHPNIGCPEWCKQGGGLHGHMSSTQCMILCNKGQCSYMESWDPECPVTCYYACVGQHKWWCSRMNALVRYLV